MSLGTRGLVGYVVDHQPCGIDELTARGYQHSSALHLAASLAWMPNVTAATAAAAAATCMYCMHYG
jgi:hypothetical protein